ncbi:MAG TPA: hypothetical protein VFD30_22965 [Terriglobia bacterium]|jgi:hypothetical protein|nr:hypothetical protein [Terriglobia bacterium]
MAVTRVVLPRKGIIQPRHGDNYEADLDTNWQIIDSSLQDAADVQAAIAAAGTLAAWLMDRGLSGVACGFDLSTSASLVPGVAPGVLYAQGIRFECPAPNPGPPSANSTSYVWYNPQAGFYYTSSCVPNKTGDAYLGTVVTDASHVTAVTSATKLYGRIPVTAPNAGNFTWPHNLGRVPAGALIYMTSGGAIWFQYPTLFDATFLYVTSSDAGVTAAIEVW